jgi:hypothetical protein
MASSGAGARVFRTGAGTVRVVRSCGSCGSDGCGWGYEKGAAPRCRSRGLPTQAQPLDEAAVALDVRLLEVLQQTAALADQEEQPAP